MNSYTAGSTTVSSPDLTKTSLFRTADGRSFAVICLLITSLFLLWGFCNGMIDILNKHFQDTLRINKEQSMRVGFIVPLVCFLFVALYGFIWAELTTLDSIPRAEESQ